MVPAKTMPFLFRNGQNSKSSAPCRFLWDKCSYSFSVIKISGYITHQKACILQALRALKFSRHGHIDKIIKVIYAFGCCVLAC